MGFHVDTGGNIWLGSGSEDDLLSDLIGTADEPSFYVTDSGTGKIGGISINNSSISSVGYSSNTGFSISSGGNAVFNNVTARGTISGSVDTTLSGGSSGYLQSGTGTTRVRLGAGGGGIDFLNSSATKGIIDTDSNGLRIRNYDSTTDKIKLYAGGLGGTGTVEINAEVLDINGSASSYNEIQVSGFSNISISGNSGTPGQLLTKTNTGIAWQSSTGHTHTGYTFPNSGELLSSSNHSHGTPLTSDHENANNPHDNYLQEADHNSNNTAHSNFLTSADLANHITNTNNIYNSVVDHTDITANQGGGSAHGLSLSGVNAAVLHVNDNSVHTNHNHNYALAEDPHGNSEHNEAYITNNNANAHHGNTYALAHNHPYAPAHNHPYASTSHGTHVDGNVLTNSNHSHNTSAIHTHNTALSTDPHGNGDHNAAFITNSNANAHHGNTYANFSHVHINPLTHDSRLLTVNANSVPGLNVVQRMNPVTANFSEQYKNKVLEEPSSLTELNQKTYRLTYQDVKQALEDDGVDTTDIAMIIENVEYANELAPELDDNMKGLMDGEIDAILVQAIKDLSAKIDLLEDRIATLEG